MDLSLEEIIEKSEKFKKPKVVGVYFLIDNYDNIVYVGQSANVYDRIGCHAKSMFKTDLRFTRYFIIEVSSRRDRIKTEMYYIKKFRPINNKLHNDDVPLNVVYDKLDLSNSYTDNPIKGSKKQLKAEKLAKLSAILAKYEDNMGDSKKTTATQCKCGGRCGCVAK